MATVTLLAINFACRCWCRVGDTEYVAVPRPGTSMHHKRPFVAQVVTPSHVNAIIIGPQLLYHCQ